MTIPLNISVVIPCRNEVNYIEECIRAIYNSDIDENIVLNVFVVDGMSDDGTRDVVQRMKKEFQSLQLIDNEKQLTPYAFNLGIHATSYDYIQIVGARHILSSNYISNCLAKLKENSSIWCVGGKIVNEYVNESGKAIALAMGTTLGMGLGNFRTLEKSGLTDTVTSPMYPARVFEKIGYFDEALIRNQDDDFNFRVVKAGGEIYFDAGISLKYYVRGNFMGLWRQFFQYGYWKVYVNKKHKAVTTIRQLVPPLFVFYLFVLLISPVVSVYFLGWMAIPLFIYCMSVLYFSSQIRLANAGVGFFSILKTFPILHVSYGLGYWKGILDFLVLKKKPSDKQKRMSR